MHCSTHIRLFTIKLTQTVEGRECSNLPDNTVLTLLRISRGFKLGPKAQIKTLSSLVNILHCVWDDSTDKLYI